MRHLRSWLALVSAFLIGAGALLPGVALAANGTQQPPRLLNLWFTWQLPDEKLQELAKWDVVVLDSDQQGRFPDRVRRLRQLNPKIKILAYVDSSSIAVARFVEEDWFPGYKLAHAIPEGMYLHRGSERVAWWPGTWMLNVTQKGQTDANGKRWVDFLPDFINREVWSSGLWDGIFLDNALEGVTYFAGKGLDMTGDGKADPDADVDREWKAGWQQMAKNLRAKLGPTAIIMGNGSAAYAGVTNGVLFENFPRYGWANGFRDYQASIKLNASPSVTSFNTNPNNVAQQTNWKLMRYGLASSLLGDGYYSFDYGDRDHGQTWWYDEYDATLGKATAAPKLLVPATGKGVVDGVWWRDYERGAVVVNSSNKSQSIDLPGIFERLRGAQDPGTNSGRVETAISLASQDGLLLYRRAGSSGIARSTMFQNGAFVRVYSAQGAQLRSAFFAQRSEVSGGASVAIQDVDRDGKSDVLSASAGEIKIRYGNGTSRSVKPFGAAYKGSMALAAGNTDRDDAWEIIASNDATGEVKVVEQTGEVRATWRPYANFRGRIWLAIGDLDGDGRREIITGAGPGGGPHIQLFKTDGTTWAGGFFGFDPAERGGVSVALGDLDADGKDELYVGSGQGSVPRVRVLNARGEVQREFALAPKSSALGVNVSIADSDGDGTLEILASGISPTP